MYLVYRKAVYITFVIIFFITAPIIVLYTSGYRYNLSKGRIQKTGILIISSIPKKADIYLNSKKVENKSTPAEIKNVLPGDYEIILSKDGYHNWQKKLPVYENFTTFAEKVNLWKIASSTQLSNSVISHWQASSDGNKIAFGDSSGLIGVFDLNDNTFNNLESLPNDSKLKNISWSKDNKKILIEYTISLSNHLLIYDINSNKSQIIENKNYANIKWSLDNDNIIYGKNEAGLWQINTANNSSELILNAVLTGDYIIENNYLYGINDKFIYRKNINDKNSTPEDIDSIACPSCNFISNNSNRIILQDGNQSLFIVDPNRQRPTVSAKAKNIDWLNSDNIMYYNDFEIWIYNFKEGTPKLITRFGQSISQAVWQPQGKHIIFASDNKIKIIELDDRELRNIIDLTNNTNIKFLKIDRKGNNLFFAGESDNKAGIFELNIQ